MDDESQVLDEITTTGDEPQSPAENEEVVSQDEVETTESEEELQEEPEEETEEEEVQSDTESKTEKRKKKIQERFDQMANERREVEKERDYWRKVALEKSEATESHSEETAPEQPQVTQPQVQAQELKEPKFEDFDGDWQAFEDAKFNYKYELKKREEEVQRYEAERQRQVQEAANRFKPVLEKAKKERLKDYDAVISKANHLNPNADVRTIPFWQFVGESEVGPDLIYHMAQHPEEMQKILAVTPVRQGVLLDALEKSIMDQVKKPAAKKKAPPAPPKPETGGTTVTGKTKQQIYDSGSFAEFKALKQAQRNKK